MSELRIGFIGLGNMGGRMATCITKAGQDVLGYDPVAANASAAGATPAGSAADVVGGSDIILLSLPKSAVVEAVMLGDGGVLEHLRDGQIVVDLSTSAPASTRMIAGKVLAAGANYLDAGISGGAAAAEKGQLVLMVGGEESVLELARPALELFSSKIFYTGASGAGHTTKLINNFLNAITLSATAEAMVAGKKAGLDLEVLLDVINNSSGVSFASLNRFPKIIRGDYLKGGLTNALMMKDVLAYVELAGDLGVASPNSAGPLASFGLANALGYAEQISNTVVDAIGDVSGGVRLFDPAPAGPDVPEDPHAAKEQP
ncbi:3-hydroxyisobutyrate dehydrogenase [Arthrobacter sp. V4I6]|uniref:NAD(P)-dependent oxidoreductase n=1 Tax=unclassified Arthrobacter TaxID=235627 RepID=UPI002781912F|nr:MULTISPECIES: NAD(P)-dependent oxidoreductase [unclassified Arthrobacter]MDQ0819619.1 3-hydroxyisobutyrate dehydrogenase [Arthrobacter sp. V1I7]MDQ0853800.1 3-hydroxyisobutyrate dehydrogenase [Arthrobacter sp. V4I6]